MILESVRVQNFRSIRDAVLTCDNLTALVGANGSGKSTFLHAVQMLQGRPSKITEEDYHRKNTEEDIVITGTFRDLPEFAKNAFAEYIHDDRLRIEMVIEWSRGKPSPAFYGYAMQNPDFADIFTENATRAKTLYDNLRKGYDYGDLLPLRSHQEIKDCLSNWEKSNPEKCCWCRDERRHTEFNGLVERHLDSLVQFLYIPAVHDAASDVSENKGSALNRLMGIVTERILRQNDLIGKFYASSIKRHANVMDPSRLKELADLEDEMNGTLREMAPDAGVTLDWNLEDLKINFPEAKVSLEEEDGYRVAVDKAGHGLQRTFLMTLLRCLAAARAENSGSAAQAGDGPPTLVLMIEEPEIYQHPVRQRHLADVLLSLAENAQQGAWGRTQVIYSTHSPHFVELDRINQIRLLRKKRGADGKPGPTEVHSTRLEDVANDLSALPGKRKITPSALESRLKGVMTPWMNEGFFSDVVVLVEGISDRAAILAVARTMGHMFDGMGISVIPCDSKTKMAKPARIFQCLGIPVYLVWDSDSKDKEGPTTEDTLLLSLGGGDRRDWPSKTADRFACFTSDMNETLRRDIGEDFAVYEKDSLEELSLKKKRDGKNPDLIRLIIEKAGQGRCKTISEIVKKIITLSQKRA